MCIYLKKTDRCCCFFAFYVYRSSIAQSVHTKAHTNFVLHIMSLLPRSCQTCLITASRFTSCWLEAEMMSELKATWLNSQSNIFQSIHTQLCGFLSHSLSGIACCFGLWPIPGSVFFLPSVRVFLTVFVDASGKLALKSTSAKLQPDSLGRGGVGVCMNEWRVTRGGCGLLCLICSSFCVSLM